jgi:hypothetical protein
VAKKARVAGTRTRPPKRRPKPTPKPSRARSWTTNAGILLGTLAGLAAIVIALTLLRDGDSTRSPLFPEASDPGPIHVHGLGINPSDGSLLIATHTGTYRVEPGEPKADRVGESAQDTMGFTVLGPDRFLGSGHPDINEAREKGLPGLLGLIESTDAGKTWEPISLLGEADFHVLRSARGRVYGFDVTNERLMVSRNAGRTWQERDEPGPLLDLVAHPASVNTLVASTESALFRSVDEGVSWQPLAEAAGLLAWPSVKRLYLVDGGGRVFESDDGGRDWRPVGEIGGQPAAFMAVSERELYVALHDGTVKRSLDGGATWRIRSKP